MVPGPRFTEYHKFWCGSIPPAVNGIEVEVSQIIDCMENENVSTD